MKNVRIAELLQKIGNENSLEAIAKSMKTLNEALKTVSENNNAEQKASIYLRFDWLMRSQRKFDEAFDYLKKGYTPSP